MARVQRLWGEQGIAPVECLPARVGGSGNPLILAAQVWARNHVCLA